MLVHRMLKGYHRLKGLKSVNFNSRAENSRHGIGLGPLDCEI